MVVVDQCNNNNNMSFCQYPSPVSASSSGEVTLFMPWHMSFFSSKKNLFLFSHFIISVVSFSGQFLFQTLIGGLHVVVSHATLLPSWIPPTVAL